METKNGEAHYWFASRLAETTLYSKGLWLAAAKSLASALSSPTIRPSFQHAPIRGVFFDEQEVTFMLDDSRNRQVSNVHQVLESELAEFDFDFAGEPDLVKHRAVEFGD